MKVPLRIFYDKENGHIIQMTGNFEDVWLTEYESVEMQIPKYTALSERNRETFDVLELPFGAYSQDFAECNGYRVNVTTGELEFSYPDPNAPTEEPVYQKPLSEQVTQLEKRTLESENAIMTLMELQMGGM
jgi:hypothetical protein